MYEYVHACMYKCMYLCVHVHVHISTYIHMFCRLKPLIYGLGRSPKVADREVGAVAYGFFGAEVCAFCCVI